MKCSCPNCSCRIDDQHRFEANGKAYCSEKCAKECTEDRCVCTPCDCPK